MEKQLIFIFFFSFISLNSFSQKRTQIEFYNSNLEVNLPENLPKINLDQFQLEPLLLTYDTWKAIFQKDFEENYSLKQSLIMDDFVWVQFLYRSIGRTI